MNITQSAFSAQMKKLERLVGVKLISRSTRGSRLTPEGELFLPEAEQVLDTLERAIQSIRLASKVERPILNIGVLRSLGDIRLNGYVSHFFQNHPEFSVSIYDMEEEELMLDLRENRIDIALLYLPNNKDMSVRIFVSYTSATLSCICAFFRAASRCAFISSFILFLHIL